MMLRRLLLAAALALAPSLASAQFAVIGPTAPTSDSSDRLATTQWVNNLVNAGLPLASGKIWIGSAAGIATPQTPSGDWTISNAGVATLATVNANVGSFGSATQCVALTTNAKGLITAASATTCTPAVGSISGLGTGIATALGVNVGLAGAPVLFNGAGGTPTSLTLTNGTGLPVGGISGLGTGVATALGTAVNATGGFDTINGTAALTNKTISGASNTLSNIGNGSLTNSATTVAGQTCTLGSTCGFSSLTNSLGANVNMTAATTYFDGPSVAQGITGTWYASGTVSLADPTAVPITTCKLWDGTTVIASSNTNQLNNSWYTIALSGVITSPAGNIKISCSSSTGTTNVIRAATQDSTTKASTVSAVRIN